MGECEFQPLVPDDFEQNFEQFHYKFISSLAFQVKHRNAQPNLRVGWGGGKGLKWKQCQSMYR